MRIPQGSHRAWWNLKQREKDVLQEQRVAGRFGGGKAAGIGAAPYFWAQEYGSAEADIKPKFWARDSWLAFRGKAEEILRTEMRSIMGI